ncbi:MAG: hypothetical protein HY039_01115 [Nitrospirae bacterium]|nr:hypothetical protein [Nitrospirota bacterium]
MAGKTLRLLARFVTLLSQRDPLQIVREDEDAMLSWRLSILKNNKFDKTLPKGKRSPS